MSLPTVLILGAGYGGIAAANALQGSAHVIVVERKQYQDHCIATPRGLCNADFAKSIVVDLHDALPHAIIINDSVTQVTMTTVQLASGVTLGFDYLVVATGSQHAIRPKASTVADAQAEYQANVAILVRSKHALIVGGGPVAVETAGELAHFYPELKLTLVTSGSKLLDTIPFDWMSAKASETLLRIQPKTSIITNRRVEDVDGTDWKNNAVSELQAPATVADQSGVDVIINAAVLRIDTGFMQVGAKDARGCLKVNEHYQLEGAEGNNVFVIGDACAKDVKMGYLAGLQGKAVAKNIKALHAGKRPKATVAADVPPAMLITLGPQEGFAQLPMPWPMKKVGSGLVKGIKGKDLFAAKNRKDVEEATTKTQRMQKAALAQLQSVVSEGSVDQLVLLNVK